MSHNSPRSLRTKTEARNRPDVVWRDTVGERSARLAVPKSQQQAVVHAGTELSRLIAESDAHLMAMRKIAR